MRMLRSRIVQNALPIPCPPPFPFLHDVYASLLQATVSSALQHLLELELE